MKKQNQTVLDNVANALCQTSAGEWGQKNSEIHSFAPILLSIDPGHFHQM
jgi:hypothetical protein